MFDSLHVLGEVEDVFVFFFFGTVPVFLTTGNTGGGGDLNSWVPEDAWAVSSWCSCVNLCSSGVTGLVGRGLFLDTSPGRTRAVGSSLELGQLLAI